PLKEFVQRLRRLIEPLDHVYSILETAFRKPFAEIRERLLSPGSVVEHNESFDASSPNQNVCEVVWPRYSLFRVVLRDQPAQRDPCLQIDYAQHRVEYLASNVFEVD